MIQIWIWIENSEFFSALPSCKTLCSHRYFLFKVYFESLICDLFVDDLFSFIMSSLGVLS